MIRPLSAWNKFVKKVFQDEKKKNPKCTFAEALKKASILKKGGKMKGGDDDSMMDDVSSGTSTLSGVSGTGVSTSVSSPMIMTESTGMSGSSMMQEGGKTRKRRSSKKSNKSNKSKKVRKSRKSRKSKK